MHTISKETSASALLTAFLFDVGWPTQDEFTHGNVREAIEPCCLGEGL